MHRLYAGDIVHALQMIRRRQLSQRRTNRAAGRVCTPPIVDRQTPTNLTLPAPHHRPLFDALKQRRFITKQHSHIAHLTLKNLSHPTPLHHRLFGALTPRRFKMRQEAHLSTQLGRMVGTHFLMPIDELPKPPGQILETLRRFREYQQSNYLPTNRQVQTQLVHLDGTRFGQKSPCLRPSVRQVELLVMPHKSDDDVRRILKVGV
jgi:hypothetical protein